MRFRAIAIIAWLTVATVNAGTVTVVQTLDLDAPVMTGGGVETSDKNFTGIVINSSPVQISSNSGTDLSFGGVMPAIDEVIGRGVGTFFGDAETKWEIPIPDPQGYVANTFDIDVDFVARFSFTGNAFSANHPNALDFELAFDDVVQTTFSAEAGFFTGTATISASFENQNPVDVVTVTMTFPDEDNSFDNGDEAFRVLDHSLTVTYSFESVPEPSPSLYVGLVLIICGMGHRRVWLHDIG